MESEEVKEESQLSETSRDPDVSCLYTWAVADKWTVNFQMFKLDLEKAEESKSKRVPEKHLLLLYWRCQSLWLCGSQQTVENSERVGIPDHPTHLLRNLYAGQEATVRTTHGTTDWFHIGKGVLQGCILSPCLFNFYAEYIMRIVGLDNARQCWRRKESWKGMYGARKDEEPVRRQEHAPWGRGLIPYCPFLHNSLSAQPDVGMPSPRQDACTTCHWRKAVL